MWIYRSASCTIMSVTLLSYTLYLLVRWSSSMLYCHVMYGFLFGSYVFLSSATGMFRELQSSIGDLYNIIQYKINTTHNRKGIRTEEII